MCDRILHEASPLQEMPASVGDDRSELGLCEAGVGGNLGNPLSGAALAERPPALAVVEVSSYQLELPGELHPKIGAILNLSPDHLERHGTMDAISW